MIRIGAIIDGKYEVTGFLGSGGMGIVVEARHLTLETLVAIKFMRSDMVASSGGVQRFMREARALVKLKSQHAVKVHDLGIYARMPYIVMEHLEGMDLQTLLDQDKRFEVADVARHMRQACEAIAEAHSRGIYHRDLKPANIFLSRGASGRTIVKVLDFGIAKILQTHASVSYVSLTGAWTMMGTPSYMSPEQLLSAKDIDGRADIWSLGVVMYELVTGMLPFQDETQLLMQRRIRFEAPRPHPLPPTLAPIILRCLEKNKEDRYQSIEDLALALRPLIHESSSPFGSLLAPKEPLREIPDKQQRELAIAEGLISRGPSAESITIRVPRLPPLMKRAEERSADSEIPYAPTARPSNDESSSSDDVATVPDKPLLQPANSNPAVPASDEALDDQVLFFEGGAMISELQRRELAIAKGLVSRNISAEPTTIRQWSQPMGVGGTLIMESEPSNAPAARQGVQPMAENETQTLVSPGCERSPLLLVSNAGPVFPSAEFFPTTPFSRRQHAMVIGIVMLMAAFLAFVVALQ